MDPNQTPVREDLNAEVKARIRLEHKQALQRIALERDLDLSDVVREAIREYLEEEGAIASPEPANVV